WIPVPPRAARSAAQPERRCPPLTSAPSAGASSATSTSQLWARTAGAAPNGAKAATTIALAARSDLLGPFQRLHCMVPGPLLGSAPRPGRIYARRAEVAMFSFSLGDDAELRLAEEIHVHDLFLLVDANRAYLRQWLPWVDATRSPEDILGFVRTATQQFASNQ